MAIEIRELHININVKKPSEVSENGTSADSKVDKQRIVEECVEKVMETIKKSTER